MPPQLSDLQRLHENLKALEDRKRFNRVLYFKPYGKQLAFIDATRTHREVLFMAANQVGKSETGAYVTAMHLTGEYPAGWPGRRFDHPTRGWICGETAEVVRDVQQKKLFGPAGVEDDFGTGMVPKHLILDKSMSRGSSNTYDTVQVRHKSGGTSVGIFKSYVQGRTKFQGDSIDWGWADEEPDEEVYSELLTRTTATDGIIYMTATPLFGMSKVVNRFLNEPLPSRTYINMTIEEAEHIPASKRREIIMGYPAHQRKTRALGIPMMGEGSVFTVAEEDISVPTIQYVPPHWAKIWGIDFGIAHPFAAVLFLWDRDNDVMYVHHCIRLSGEGSSITPINHAEAMKAAGEAVPVAWPHDGNNREKGSGETLARQYKAHGLKMLGEHATFAGGGNSVEAGITEMTERMVSGRFKVEAHCLDWFEEFRMYHRKDGMIVKKKDDLMAATRYGMMMRRHASVVPLGRGSSDQRRGRNPVVAADTDFDLFA